MDDELKQKGLELLATLQKHYSEFPIHFGLLPLSNAMRRLHQKIEEGVIWGVCDESDVDTMHEVWKIQLEILVSCAKKRSINFWDIRNIEDMKELFKDDNDALDSITLLEFLKAFRLKWLDGYTVFYVPFEGGTYRYDFHEKNATWWFYKEERDADYEDEYA